MRSKLHERGKEQGGLGDVLGRNYSQLGLGFGVPDPVGEDEAENGKR